MPGKTDVKSWRSARATHFNKLGEIAEDILSGVDTKEAIARYEQYCQQQLKPVMDELVVISLPKEAQQYRQEVKCIRQHRWHVTETSTDNVTSVVDAEEKKDDESQVPEVKEVSAAGKASESSQAQLKEAQLQAKLKLAEYTSAQNHFRKNRSKTNRSKRDDALIAAFKACGELQFTAIESTGDNALFLYSWADKKRADLQTHATEILKAHLKNLKATPNLTLLGTFSKFDDLTLEEWIATDRADILQEIINANPKMANHQFRSTGKRLIEHCVEQRALGCIEFLCGNVSSNCDLLLLDDRLFSS